MGELLTDHLAHRAENIAYLAHYRTNLPAPELGDDGESQGASPPPQLPKASGIICMPCGLDFNEDICKHVFQTC